MGSTLTIYFVPITCRKNEDIWGKKQGASEQAKEAVKMKRDLFFVGSVALGLVVIFLADYAYAVDGMYFPFILFYSFL